MVWEYIHDPYTQRDYEFDGFHLTTATSPGRGDPTLVIGSSKYYPRTFGLEVCVVLKHTHIDTRWFTPDDPKHTEEDFTLDKIMQDIDAVRRDMGYDRILLIGHSIHAFMAMEYAKRFPDKITHLVLIGCSPIIGEKLQIESDKYFEKYASNERKAAFSANMELLKQKSNPTFVDLMLASTPKLFYDYNFDASSLWEGVQVNTIGTKVVLEKMFVDYDVAKAFESMRCPVFIASGEYDFANPSYLWDPYVERYMHLRAWAFYKTGNHPHFEDDLSFWCDILEWVGRNDHTFDYSRDWSK